jgi:hypothetical protein
MRVYFAAGADDLVQLRDGRAVRLPGFVPESEDELDEFEALSDAAEAGAVAIAADVDEPDQQIALDHVASFHLDADGSGDLAWYAAQELDQVIPLISPR